MNRFFLVIVLILLPFSARPDSPGYLGHHFLISYGPDFSVTNYPLIFSAKGSQLNSIPNEKSGIYFRHNFDAELVINRSLSIGGEYSFYDHSTSVYSDLKADADYLLKIHGESYAVNLLFYNAKGSPIAPVGNFIKVKFFMTRFSASASNASGTLPSDIGSAQYNGNTFGAGLGFGHNHIIANRILISYGASFEYNIDFPGSDKQRIHEDALHHIRGTYIMPAAKLAIGGLLF